MLLLRIKRRGGHKTLVLANGLAEAHKGHLPLSRKGSEGLAIALHPLLPLEATARAEAVGPPGWARSRLGVLEEGLVQDVSMDLHHLGEMSLRARPRHPGGVLRHRLLGGGATLDDDWGARGEHGQVPHAAAGRALEGTVRAHLEGDLLKLAR